MLEFLDIEAISSSTIILFYKIFFMIKYYIIELNKNIIDYITLHFIIIKTIFTSFNNFISMFIHSILINWLIIGIISPILFIILSLFDLGTFGNLISGLFIFRLIYNYITNHKKSENILDSMSKLRFNFKYYKNDICITKNKIHELKNFDISKIISKNESNVVIAGPHGIFGVCYCLNIILNKYFYSKQYLDCNFVISNILINLPFIHELLTTIGCISSDLDKIKECLNKKENIAILIGGFEEAAITEYRKHTMYLENLGMIYHVLSMENNSDCINYSNFYCVYLLNEPSNYYTYFNNLKKIKLRISKTRFFPGCFSFSGFCGLLPIYYKRVENITLLHDIPIKIPHCGKIFSSKDKYEKNKIIEYFGSKIAEQYIDLFESSKRRILSDDRFSEVTRKILYPEGYKTNLNFFESKKKDYQNFYFDCTNCCLIKKNN